MIGQKKIYFAAVDDESSHLILISVKNIKVARISRREHRENWQFASKVKT